eukprot:m.230157 g.230157  ORF g.230157 m.230157 type:complete len:94 (-) comp15997_c1_seq14:334-615(-)
MQTNAGDMRLSMRAIGFNIWREDGLRGLWAGLVPNVTRCFLVNAAEIGTYDEAKEFYKNVSFLESSPMLQHVFASGTAGYPNYEIHMFVSKAF